MSTLSLAHARRRIFLTQALDRRRRFHFWILARGGGSTDDPSTASVDVSFKRKPIEPIFNQYPVSVCSVRGLRSYMEDEWIVQNDFAAVFDGHGGKAVSRYLRQNLYANLQAALPRKDTVASSDPKSLEQMIPVNSSSTANRTAPTVEDYEAAIEAAIHKVNKEVQRISHWSFQGSTATSVWIHEFKQDDRVKRTFVTANVGDSRAVLSRNHTAIQLSRDHKPNDPIERVRIEALGGTVVWHGSVDRSGHPIPGTGIWRVNGNLALSRAVGDRSEAPAVTADPEISVVTMSEDDDFLVLATDGLWDVMSSADVVAFIHALLLEAAEEEVHLEKDHIASMVVEEALRRGSYDNITVVILWINDRELLREEDSV